MAEETLPSCQHCGKTDDMVGKVPCVQCGTPVTAQYSMTRSGQKSDKKFCSRKCYDAFRTDIQEARAKECPRCQKRFIPRMPSKRYCSEECWLADKKAKPKNCVNCGCWFTPVKPMKRADGIRWTSHNGGKTCSAKCHLNWYSNNEDRKIKISKAFTGDKHPNWLGGATWRSSSSYRGPNWDKIAEKARKRDEYRCQHCSMAQPEHFEKFASDLNVHHIEPFHNFKNSKEANHLSNLITLCRPCHSRAEAMVSAVQMTLPLADNRHGIRPGHRKGEGCHSARLNRDDVLAIRKRAADQEPLTLMAQEYGVTVTTISNVVRGRTWKHLPITPTSRPQLSETC